MHLDRRSFFCMRYFLLVLLLASCEQRAQITSTGQPIASAQPTIVVTQAAAPPATSAFNDQLPPQANLPQPSVTPVPMFVRPEAQAALNNYSDAVQELKALPQPPVDGAVTNPGSLTGYLDQLGAKLDQMKRARQEVQENLAPGEKERWKALQRSITNPTPDED